MKYAITPGPWRIAPAADYTSGVNIDSKAGYVCAVGVTSGDNTKLDATILNDAAAIAACPEMMDVLDALASCQWQEEITSIRERAISVLQRIPKNGEKK